jgi:hypothetical protein
MKTMSRHTFPGHAGQTVNIGWDRPLATFFVQITRPHPTHKGDDEIVEWRGTDYGELPTAASAIAVAAAYGDLPAELGATLETDRMKTLGQTDGPAQMAARRFRHNDSQ